MWQGCVNAASIEDVLTLLSQNATRAKLIAGGTDLILEFERELRPTTDMIIDISRIKGLDSIYQSDDGIVHIGALVTHNQAVSSALLRRAAFPLVKACWEVGSPQIRNRGTIVGNLVTGSPANDTIPALIALDAEVAVRSISGERVIKLKDFYTGVRRTVLQPNEMIVEVRFKGLRPNQPGTFIKYALRKAQAISVVNSAVVLTVQDDRVVEARIALGAVSPVIIRAEDAEKYLLGQEMTSETILKAAEFAAMAARPITDIRGSAEFRKYLVKIVVRQALAEISTGKERDSVPNHPIFLRGKKTGSQIIGTTWMQVGETPIETTINGKAYRLFGANHKTLLDLLREDAGLVGTKEGCAEGECGACTVFLDDIAVMSCLVPAARAHGANIVTVEGLAEGDTLHPVQAAFIEEGAVQCGYCTPGFLMSAAKLLEENPTPSQSEIRQALTGNLCRCTGYYKIIQAVERAASAGG